MEAVINRSVSELEENSSTQSAGHITNRIHAAPSIKQILVDLKEGILNLFSAHSITIYVVDGCAMKFIPCSSSVRR